jgi:hypothetical protein
MTGPFTRLLAASVFYLGWFVVLTWPAARHFSTHFITDQGDGLTNVWNLWWMHEAIVKLRVWPLRTTYLHFPHGTTLLGHTLNPFNGLLTLPLLGPLSLTVAHNVVIVFSFVVGGLTAAALCHHVSRSPWGSLWGGFVFTFSSFHFAHAEGHMQMVALEWIPLFVLCWLRWLERPSGWRAGAAAGALVLVLLCDLYFTFFCLLAAALMTLWHLWSNGDRRHAPRDYIPSVLVFALAAGLPVGGFAGALLLQHRGDPFVGAHDPAASAMDLLAPFIYGGHWRFGAWTAPYWRHIAGNVHESSLHLGWTVIATLAYCVWNRRRIERGRPGLWFALAAVFAALALGPTLRVWGRPFAGVPMPYDLLAALVPPLALAGAVARFFVMTTLAAGVLVAMTLPLLRRRLLARPLCIALAGAALAVEHWPAPLPLTRIPVPAYVEAVAAAPGSGAVVDLVSTPPLALYFQTVHAKPMALGYIARYPLSTVTRGHPILLAARAVVDPEAPSREAAATLAGLGFRHLIAPRTPVPVPFLSQRHADRDVIVYDLERS